MMSRREMLDHDLKMLDRRAEQKDPDGEYAGYAKTMRRATNLLWVLFREIENEPINGFFGFRNRKRTEMICRFDEVALLIGFTSYQHLRGR